VTRSRVKILSVIWYILLLNGSFSKKKRTFEIYGALSLHLQFGQLQFLPHDAVQSAVMPHYVLRPSVCPVVTFR